MALVIPNMTTIEITRTGLLNSPTDPNDPGVLGYAFATPGNAANPDEADQVQRWVLFEDSLLEFFFPFAPVRIAQTIRTGWKTGTGGVNRVEDFITKARNEFTQGRAKLYVKANAKISENAATIRRPLDLPKFLPPARVGAGSQGYFGTSQIRSNLFNHPVGYVYVEEKSTVEYMEHWALFSSYREPSGATEVTVRGDFGVLTDFADLLDRTSWHSNCTFASIACGYYKEVPGSGPSDL